MIVLQFINEIVVVVYWWKVLCSNEFNYSLISAILHLCLTI